MTLGQRPATPPARQSFWVAHTSGSGEQSLTWPVRRGDWTFVVMNADGSPRVDADVAVGASLPGLDRLVTVLLTLSGLGLLISGVALAVTLSRARKPGPPAAVRTGP
jgi:hypothetical protein